MNIKERICHIQLRPVDPEPKMQGLAPKPKEKLSANPNIQNDVSANDLRLILLRVDEMEKRMTIMNQEYTKN